MKKYLTILCSILSLSGYGQTKTTFTRSAAISVNAGKGAQHWGTSDWGAYNATPTIPAGNSTPKNFYTRFNWLDIESSTSQGTYTWTTFDAFVNQAIDSGAMFSFGVMAYCDGCGSLGLVPTYVQTLMTNEGKPGWSNGNMICPNYQSTNWAARYNALLRAIATHIASTSRSGKTYTSAFLGFDLRHYGNFGEGWGDGGAVPPAGARITDAFMNMMVDSAAQIFPNVQLTIPMAYVAPFNSCYSCTATYNTSVSTQDAWYVLTKSNSYGRIGWRRDNIGDDGYNVTLSGCTGFYNPGSGNVNFAPLIMSMYKYAPIGGEPAIDYCGTSRCGWIFCDFHNEDTTFHYSYFGNGNYPIAINANGTVNCSGNTPQNTTHGGDSLVSNVRAASLEQGYSLVLDSAYTTTSPILNGNLAVSLYWGNTGLAPVYEKWNVQFELRQSTTVKLTATSGFTPRLFLPTTTDSVYTDNISLTGLPVGTYDLYVIIRDPNSYKKPLALATNGVNADGSYLVRSGIQIVSGGNCNCYTRPRGTKLVFK